MKNVKARRMAGSVLFLHAALLAPWSLHAQALRSSEGFGVHLSAELRDEDNPFRLAPDRDPALALGRSDKSDRIAIYEMGLRFRQIYSMQRVELEAARASYRYQTFDRFDFDATSYHAAWLWRVTPKLSGVVSADRSEVLKDYADFSSFSLRNVQTEKRHLASADWLFGADWHFVGALIENRSRNSEAPAAVGDDVREMFEVGVRRTSGPDNSLALVARHANGRYEGRVANPFFMRDVGFDDHEVEARLAWSVSGKGHLNARLGYFQRRHDNFPARDFSGPVARIDYLWTAGGRTSLAVSAGRALHSYQEVTNSYYIARDISVQPAWAVSNAVLLHLRLEEIQRDYRGALFPLGALREDRLHNLELGADWSPGRVSTFQLYWETSRRASNYARFDFRARAFGVRAQLRF